MHCGPPFSLQKHRMKLWIVTGGIASGKSLFCQQLQEAVPASVLFSSDGVVHELLQTPALAAEIAAEFGPTVLAPSGGIDRQGLRAAVLEEGGARKRLEAILHPAVYRALESLRSQLDQKRNTQLLIAEVPLFYESRGQFPADLVIVVATGATLQQERLTGPRSLDPVTAERFRAAQWPLSRKLDPADKIVWNEGSLTLLELQARLLVQQLDNS